MKRLIPVVAMILGWALAAWGAEAPAPLTNLQAIHSLSNAEASLGLPVAFEATVTYYPGYAHLLFVQDGSQAIFVLATTDAKLVPGDRVLVRGITRESFHPIVVSNSVTVLGHGDLPKPVPASFDGLIHGQYDCMLVSVHGVVRTANLGANPSLHRIFMQMIADGGYIDAVLESDDANLLKGLLDAEVEVTGIAGGTFDGKMQQTGILLHIPTLAGIKILKRAGVSPQSIPITPMGEILNGYHVQDQSQRVRVHGTITYYQPGRAVVLQDGASSLWITTISRSPLRIGDVADATGFPEIDNGALVLTHSEIEDSGVKAPILPQPASWLQLAHFSNNRPDGHMNDLVSIEGQVVTEVRGAARDEYVLLSGGQLFSAVYRHPDQASHIQLLPMKEVPPGSRIRVTGICMNEDSRTFNNETESPFNILLRSFDDITVVAGPHCSTFATWPLRSPCCWWWWRLRGFGAGASNARWATKPLSYRLAPRPRPSWSGGAAASLWTSTGRARSVRSSKRSLELVSFTLNGAAWCETANGGQFGYCPPKADSLRIIRAEIPARSGPPLGTLFVAFGKSTIAPARESEALSLGTELATLAMETSHLYSDLRHRSEFDLLTDTHNRFSLHSRLDALIEEARQNASIFGLICIDLDKFKPINDRYGHHVGDLFLQEVALRMKRQLRGRTSWRGWAATNLPRWFAWRAAARALRKSPCGWNAASTRRLRWRATNCVARPASALPSIPRMAPTRQPAQRR